MQQNQKGLLIQSTKERAQDFRVELSHGKNVNCYLALGIEYRISWQSANQRQEYKQQKQSARLYYNRTYHIII